MSLTKAKFTVTRCAATVGNQKSAPGLNACSSNVDKSSTNCSAISPHSRAVSLVLKLREQDAQDKMMLSRQAVQQHHDAKREAFLVQAKADSEMLSVHRQDQKIGVKMLAVESWRYQQTHPVKKSQQQASTLCYKLTAKSLAELIGDVDVLMNAKWKPLSTGAAATAENHPYLFTINQIHRLKLFLSSGLNRK